METATKYSTWRKPISGAKALSSPGDYRKRTTTPAASKLAPETSAHEEKKHLPVLNLSDVQIHYQFEGAGNGPVLMLANSLGANLELWSEQVASFSKHFSLLRYDARGQGRSSTPAGPYTIAQMGADALGLMDALGLNEVSFCGISMGGLVGQWIGIHAPHRLHKLVLSNTAARIGKVEGWNDRIAIVQSHGIDAIIPTVLKGWFTEPFHRGYPAVVARMEQVLRANPPAGYLASIAAVRDADQRAMVEAIHAPTLVVYGTEDQSTTATDARFLVDHIPGSRELQLQAAHLSNIEAAPEFNAGVLHFLLG